MSDADALRSLLAACKEDLDDTPRLVFADWLEEHGEDQRGQLLRVQCELARTEEHAPRRPYLLQQETELLKNGTAGWLGPLSSIPGKWSFQRGLLGLECFAHHSGSKRGKLGNVDWKVNVGEGAHLTDADGDVDGLVTDAFKVGVDAND